MCSGYVIQRFHRARKKPRIFRSASSEGRTWYGCSPYNPETVVKVLEIFRVVYNYCSVGDDKLTPAMRLGLAKGPVDLEDLIYFSRDLTNVKAA